MRSGDLVFVPAQVGDRADGSPEADFEAQVRGAFANLEAALRAAGCGFADIVDVTTFQTEPEDQRDAVAAVKGELFDGIALPAWTALGVTWLSGFAFAIKATARVPSRPSTSVIRRNPPTMWDMAALGYSQISVAEPGRLAFLSGQIAATPAGGPVPADVACQATIAVAGLAAALDDLGATAHDIVLLRLYVVDATTEAFGQALIPLRALFADAKPSITTIGVQALYRPEIRVEIEMVVRVP